jgi:hypothetical protein
LPTVTDARRLYELTVIQRLTPPMRPVPMLTER